ncbi:MAG: glycosyl hydrolase family 76 [Draconibacterium sp.]|nr:MAG: glycosyl hydrolase family 76 [Draconibacterium sp.]
MILAFEVKFLNFILLALTLNIALSCSKNSTPLVPDRGTGSVVIDWGKTADSIQDATYITYLGTNGTFNQDNQGNTTFNYWPNAHVLNILTDAYLRTNKASYFPKMINLLHGIKSKNGDTFSIVYNDDMLWLANACIRAYNATGNEQYKQTAEFLWNDVILSYSDVFGGGITWKKDTPKLKNAVSNAPAIILAVNLYKLTNNNEYLEWAKSLYEWQKANLVDPTNGHVWDHITEVDGKLFIKKDWIFTYNMGTWIGSGLELYNVTKDQSYLNDALKSARTSLSSHELTSEGVLRDEGQGDGGLFKGIFIRYLTQFALEPELSETDRKNFIAFIKFNAETFYKKGLKRPEMLAGSDWKKLPPERTDLTTQLSGVMLIEALATLEKKKLID